MALHRGRPVGTICCAEDRKINELRGLKDCVIGFFECVDDYAVAEAMFNHARGWAIAHSLETLYGPFNLDYEDGYGVLLEGRDRPPALLCGHTPPYYQDFFDRYGFQPARGDNIAFAITPAEGAKEIQHVARLAEYLHRKGRITVRGGDLAHWDEEIDRIHILLNKSTAHLTDFIPWTYESVHNSMKPFKDIVDPELILFAEADGQTVGWFPGIPNLNEALIKANGLRYPWNYLQLWWAMKKPVKCLAIKSVLVLPEYWDTGVAVMLFDEMAKRALPKGYTWFDLSLTSSDNPYTPALAERAGAKLYKRYRVYRMGF
jgi:GNAT superfamily N-acetyltransferase